MQENFNEVFAICNRIARWRYLIRVERTDLNCKEYNKQNKTKELTRYFIYKKYYISESCQYYSDYKILFNLRHIDFNEDVISLQI